MARGLPTGGQGSRAYVLCAEPKEHKHFRPGTRPGGSVTGVTQKLFVYVPFPAPRFSFVRGRSENKYGAVIHFPVVCLVRLSALGVSGASGAQGRAILVAGPGENDDGSWPAVFSPTPLASFARPPDSNSKSYEGKQDLASST